MNKYLLIIFLFPSLCVSETSLWKISKNGYHLYLGGTIHLLKKEDYPLPVEFSEAYLKSDKLIFETNIEESKTPEFSKKMMRMMSLPPGKSLKDVLNESTFYELKKYLSDRDIPIESLLGFKPSMVVLIVSIIELKRMGMVEIGVDEYFYQKAKSDKKIIGYFESVDEQLAFLSAMGAGNENEIILNTLNDMKKMDSMMSVIKSAWLNGDENKLSDVTLAEMVRDYPKLHELLVVQRNNNWMPHIKRMLKDKPTELVLVGALHLVGEKGLLQQLRRDGYVVTRF